MKQNKVTITKQSESGETLTAEVMASSAGMYERKGWTVEPIAPPTSDASGVTVVDGEQLTPGQETNAAVVPTTDDPANEPYAEAGNDAEKVGFARKPKAEKPS